MHVDAFLSSLHGVKKSGSGWRADCPNGHDKAKGSLSISEGSSGAVLLHCFACGDVPGILGTLGLELADLYPERPRDHSPEARKEAHEAFKRSAWHAALGVLGREARVVQIAAIDITAGRALTTEDAGRLAVACDRIDRAREVLT